MWLFRSSGRKQLRTGRFDASKGRWDYADPATLPAYAEAISCVTFNVWFGERCFEERFLALMALLEQRRPDVIALQEVTTPFLAGLRATPWIRRDYTLSDFMGSTLSSYGVALLSRLPVESMALHDLPTRMDRKLLLGYLLVNDTRLAVATVHMESLVDSAPWRARQLEQIFRTLKGERDAILMGDFNFCSSWAEEQACLDRQYMDVWSALHADKPGYTADIALNPMLAASSKDKKSSRYDRVLVRSDVPGWEPESVELIGTEPIAPDRPDVFPSDHFGIFARLRWRD
jgi:endonuclease/exonuclease/phosphatase family metal-dependent hydrolase